LQDSPKIDSNGLVWTNYGAFLVLWFEPHFRLNAPFFPFFTNCGLGAAKFLGDLHIAHFGYEFMKLLSTRPFDGRLALTSTDMF
jgi:hypothetical protein